MMLNDVRTIVDNLEDFIELPNGIERLRKTVLALAVSGKLVAQDPAEGTGEELYSEIQKIRQSEALGVSKKKASMLKEISFDDIPFEIPKTWKWVHIQSVAHDCGQKTPDKDFCYIDVSSIDAQKGIIKEPKMMIASNASSRARKLVKNGSVIYSGIRPYLLNTAVVDLAEFDKEVIVSTAFFVLQPLANISSEFIHLVIRSPFFDDLANKESVGAAYPAINADKFLKLPVPLPPIAEQKRIVTKVEKVMQALDTFETKKQERDEVRKRLTRNAMHSLGLGDAKIALQDLQELVKTPNDVKELEKSILMLAVSGKIISQDAKDEPASVALADAGVDMKRWEVASDERRYAVPETWTWIRFAGVGEQRLGKMLDAAKNKGDLKPYLRNTNVQWMEFELNDVKEMRIENREQGQFQLREGDLLICEGGEPGRCAIWKGQVPEMYFQKALHRVRPCTAIRPEFLALHLQIDCQNGVLAKYFTGATIKHLTGRSLERYPIPLPPLAEQIRIVKKVEEMMRITQSLRATLSW